VYNESVQTALNPQGMEQALMLYDTLMWPVAVCIALPLIWMLFYAFVLGEQRRENFWLLMVTGLILGIGAVVLLPLALLHL